MISRDVILTNCQNKINTMSNNASTIKSIFLSLSIAIVAAYYSSSFFGFFLKENDTNFVIATTAIFSAIEILINIVFTLLLTSNFSIERGYIALYYYCDKVNNDEKDGMNGKVDAKFVGYQYVSLRKYNKKSDVEKSEVERSCDDYLFVINGYKSNKVKEDLIKDYNESPRIKHTSLRECFNSPSIYGFTIANAITLVCILALFFTRLYC